ncbi:GumC family protein [Aureimonas sp. AU40]|uniref:GumC family protein n=1 Tax=Aureimonas sp. AU40 TaxID=1637747 RepID=UPI0007850D5C|nr:Wzz/FepE/Etk N-terminal domain-containing protein [Aureimonas sp. AU40]
MGDLDLRFYLSILLRRLPMIVAIVCLVTALGVTIAHLLPRTYRSSATLMVEPPQISETLAPSTVPPNTAGQLQIIQQQVLNGPSLLALADRFDIYPDRGNLTALDIVADMRSRAGIEPVALDGAAGSKAISFAVSFDAARPEIAFQVVEELVDRILRMNSRTRTDRAVDTLAFFQGEVKRLDAVLSGQESRILNFKNEHRNALPDSLDFRRQEQGALQERLLQLEREAAALRSRRTNLQQFADMAEPSLGPAAALTPEEQLLDQYRRTLLAQRALFTEASPGIRSLQSQIAALEAAVRAQRLGNPSPDKGRAPPSSTALQLADIDGQLDFIAKEGASTSSALEELSRSIVATPGNASVLNALERSSRNTQTEYDSAVARLAAASTGEQIELRAKGEKLALVDPPLQPHDPIRPNRLKIAFGSFAAGMGLSLGLLVLLEMTNRSVRRPLELAQATEIETFAVIPFIRTRQERFSRRVGMALSLMVLLAVLPVALYAIEAHREILDAASSRILFRMGYG